MSEQNSKLGKLVVVMIAAAIIVTGWLLGYPLVAVLAALAAYGIWSIFNILRLKRWLQNPEAPAPGSYGIWTSIFDRIISLEQASREQEDQQLEMIRDFQNLTDALPDATLVVDEDGNINWFNNAASELLGLKDPEDLGQSVTNLIRDPDFSNWLAVKDEVSSKLEMASPTDENKWFSASAVDYSDDQRLLILQDITDVYNMNRVRRDFVANISHELRTPLTVLLGYLEMMDMSEESEEIVHKMKGQAQQMQGLLADLLELSRLQNERTIGEEESIDVPAMLAQLREQVEEVSRGRHEVVFNVQPDLHLSGISADIESAFRNLLLNAVSYTPEGGSVTAVWHQTDEGGEFRVIDTGIGIPHRDIPRLTERFYRVAQDRARITGGTGLGLSIVKHVLNAHQAKMQITSELGEGSTFTCIFPDKRLRDNPHTLEAKAS